MATKLPNIIFITWHDAGQWFGCYGNENVHTPNVDRLASRGVRFSDMHSACAICSPSRAAIMTGRWCQDNGVIFLTNTVNNNRFHKTERHMSRMFREEYGYYNVLFNVQHECAHEHVSEVINPEERYCVHPWRSSDKVGPEMAKWIKEHKDDEKPFFLQYGSFDAHLGQFYSGKDNPNYQPLEDDEHGVHIPPYLQDSEGTRKTVKILQGQLRRGDGAIGNILDALDETGLSENTLVVMCVDHGVGLPRAKGNCYDPGTTVAWIMRYPGVIPEGTVVRNMAHQVDILPTLCDLLDVPIPENVQGVSFASHAKGESTAEIRDECYSHMVENIRSLRTRDYRLIRNLRQPRIDHKKYIEEGMPMEAMKIEAEPSHLELYDLAKDPNQFNNVAGDPEYDKVLKKLNGQLMDFLLDHNDFCFNETPDSDWQKETRRHVVEHCERVGRPVPVIDGN